MIIKVDPRTIKALSPFRPPSSWTRFRLEGFLLRVKDGELTVVTTNGHVLAMCRETKGAVVDHNSKLADHDFNLSLKPAAIPFICRYWRDDVLLEVDTVANTASIDGTIFTDARHDEDYPDFEQVVPDGLRGGKPTLFSIAYLDKIAQCVKTLDVGTAIKLDYGKDAFEPIVVTVNKEPALRFVLMPIRDMKA